MLFDKNLNYKTITDEEFEKEIELFKGESSIEGNIYYFYSNDKGEIIKKKRSLDEKPYIEDNLKLLLKYFVIRVKVDEKVSYDYEDFGDAYKIINLGNFYISDIYKMSEDKINDIKELFDKYDNNYKEYTFPWSDEEFILKYNYRNN